MITNDEKEYIKSTIQKIKSSLPQGVTLLAATKTVSAEKINYAADCGIEVIGENRVNELLEKYNDIDKSRFSIHFIGKLQTNKVKYIIDKVSLIHSVDSLKLAAEIDKQAKKNNLIMSVLVEINIGGEESKSGIKPEEAESFIRDIAKFENIKVMGLMTIPPISDETEKKYRYYEEIQKIYLDIAEKKVDNVSMSILSMGMSGDYSEAVACGSTLVRIGSLIFGKRV